MVFENKRIPNYDWMKGVAILFVVIGHVVQFNTISEGSSHLLLWIGSFHMPVFFILSGYFVGLSLSKEKNFSLRINNRFLTLLIPYLIWTYLIPLLVNFDINHIQWRWLYDSDGRYWYVQELFYLSAIYITIYTLTSRLITRREIHTIATSVLSLCICAFFFYCFKCNVAERGLHYMPLLVCGIIFYQKNFFQLISRNDIMVMLSIMIFLVCSVHYDDSQRIFYKLLKYPAGVGASIMLYTITSKLDFNNRLNRAIVFCGRNSIVIYLTHFSFVSFISTPCQTDYYYSVTPIAVFAVAFFVAILLIFICLGFGRIVRISPLLFRLLYGVRL